MTNMEAIGKGLHRRPTAELLRRYERLDSDRSTLTFEQECRRMAFLQAIAAVLSARGVGPDGHPIVYP